MVEKKWALLGGIILLTLIGFIAVNKYWFYPQFTAKTPLPPQYTSPADNPKIVLIKPFEGTLKKIINEPESDTLTGSTESKRNPFLWDGELTPPPPPPPKKVAKAVQPVEIPMLGMILTGGVNGKTAMLDKSLVHPGDSYGGHIVEDISPTFVILSGAYGVLKISMPATSFGAPQVDILEENNSDLLIKPVFADKKRRQTRQ